MNIYALKNSFARWKWRKELLHHLTTSLYWIQYTSIYSFYNEIGNRPGKSETRDYDDGEEEVSIECGRRRDHRNDRGCGIQESGAVVKNRVHTGCLA